MTPERANEVLLIPTGEYTQNRCFTEGLKLAHRSSQDAAWPFDRLEVFRTHAEREMVERRQIDTPP